MNQRIYVITFQSFSRFQIDQLDHEVKADDFGSDRFYHLAHSFCGAAGGYQIVNDNDLITGL